MTATTDVVTSELHPWLAGNWDPDLTVGEWWERLGLAGWAAPSLPEHAYGRGLSFNEAAQVRREIAAFGALPGPVGLGTMLAAPTLAVHGTPEQIATYLRDIVTGQKAWCQLFSEPGAGSDLAGLSTRAVLDGDEWVVNGQKVWTSGGRFADVGMLLARTNPEAPKHQGISYTAFGMRQPGVEVRPLREMTGNAIFNEVFINEARAPATAVIGEVHGGWGVAQTTLFYERAGVGTGGAGGFAGALPGTVHGHLDRRVGDCVRRPGSVQSASPSSSSVPRAQMLTFAVLRDVARANGTATDPGIRQGLVQLRTLEEITRLNNDRSKAVRAAGGEVPGIASIAKLSLSNLVRLRRDLGLRIVGAHGMLHAYGEAERAVLDAATENPLLASVTGAALGAQGPPIYGGTDQIQRNIMGERVLGLPKEPSG